MLAREQARQYVNNYTAGGAAFASIPMPGTSLALTAAEVKMIHGISKIYGLSLQGAVGALIIKMIMGSIGGSFVLKSLAEGLGFIPIFGWVAKPFVAAAAIKGFGEATIAYFENKFPSKIAECTPTMNEMISAFGPEIAYNYFENV